MDKQLHENAERIYRLFSENYVAAITNTDLISVRRDLADLLDEVEREIVSRGIR